MISNHASDAAILVVSDVATDADLVQSLLKERFKNVLVSVDDAVDVFRQSRPSVVVLAFKDLEQAAGFYPELCRGDTEPQAPVHPHQAVLLCDRRDVWKAYELCISGQINDYVQFWPNTYDAPRLPMSVQRALRDCARTLPPSTEGVGKSEEAVAPHIEGARPELEQVPPRSLSILIVDDDPFQRQVVGRVVESAGYRATYADGGNAGFSLACTMLPDLILMDVSMPDMSGLDVVQQLKAVPKVARIPVIMVSGKSERDVVLESAKLGVANFVVKPVDRKVLLDRIGCLLAPNQSRAG